MESSGDMASLSIYADDTLLYVEVSPDYTRPIDALFRCILVPGCDKNSTAQPDLRDKTEPSEVRHSN